MNKKPRKKRECKHRDITVERIKLPKGTEFEPEPYNEMVVARCLNCRKVVYIEYY